MKYIKCSKCNNDGKTPEPCRCAERSDSELSTLLCDSNGVLECDKCGWHVPATAQDRNTKCWSCIDGVQRPSLMTLQHHEEIRHEARRGMIRRVLNLRLT